MTQTTQTYWWPVTDEEWEWQNAPVKKPQNS
jgi:hypothetical protein